MPILTAYILALVLASSTTSAQNKDAAELSFGCDLELTAPPPTPAKVRIEALFAMFPSENVTSQNTDLILIDGPYHETVRVSRGRGYLYAPTEVTWHRKIDSFENILTELSPANRARLERQVATSQDIVRSELGPLTTEEFRKWYKVYDQTRKRQKLGSRQLDPDWAIGWGSNLDNIGKLFFYDTKTGDLLGGLIFMNDMWSNLQVVFEAYKTEAQPLNLAARAFSEIMDYGLEKDLSELQYVHDRNLFGLYSSMSSFELRASLMEPAAEFYQRLVKVLNTDILNRDFAIFEYHSGELVLHHFTDRPRDLKLRESIGVITHNLKRQ